MYKYLLLLGLGLTLSVHAQQNHPFPTEDSRWVNSYSEIEFNGGMPFLRLVHSPKFCLEKADTLIGSSLYQKLFVCGDSLRYFGATQSVGQKVYFIPKDSLQPLLIYDFGLAVGDTLKQVYAVKFLNYMDPDPFQWRFDTLHSGPDPLRVNQIDTLQTPSGPRRRFSFDNSSSGQWIEGVGNTQGFLWDPYANISGFQIELHCHSSRDTIRYPALSLPGAAGECDLDLRLSKAQAGKVSLYPNPSDQFFVVRLPQTQKVGLLIFDHQGQLVKEIESYRTGRAISTRNWPSGFYMIQIRNEQSTFSKGLLIRH